MKSCDFVIKVFDGNMFQICSCLVLKLTEKDAPKIGTRKGKMAKKKLEGLILKRRIKYSELSRDKYGRIIASVWVNKKNINKEMIKFIKKIGEQIL